MMKNLFLTPTLLFIFFSSSFLSLIPLAASAQNFSNSTFDSETKILSLWKKVPPQKRVQNFLSEAFQDGAFVKCVESVNSNVYQDDGVLLRFPDGENRLPQASIHFRLEMNTQCSGSEEKIFFNAVLTYDPIAVTLSAADTAISNQGNRHSFTDFIQTSPDGNTPEGTSFILNSDGPWLQSSLNEKTNQQLIGFNELNQEMEHLYRLRKNQGQRQ